MILSALLLFLSLQVDPGGDVAVDYDTGATVVDANIDPGSANSWSYTFDRSSCTDKGTTVKLVLGEVKGKSYIAETQCGEIKNEQGDILKYSTITRTKHNDLSGKTFQAVLVTDKAITVSKPEVNFFTK